MWWNWIWDDTSTIVTVLESGQSPDYLLRASFSGFAEDPASSPIFGEAGRVELTHPNSKFYLNGDLFCRPNGSGANFDTFAIGADASGNAFSMVNGSLVVAQISAIASKGIFGLPTSKSGSGSPRFEWEATSGLLQVAGIRETGGGFSAHVHNLSNPANLWLLWTDKLYFGANDLIIHAQSIAPSGSRYPMLGRQLIAGEWRNHALALSNDFPDFLTGKTAGYTLSMGEYRAITNFIKKAGGGEFYAGP